jgi:hypothetical protein
VQSGSFDSLSPLRSSTTGLAVACGLAAGAEAVAPWVQSRVRAVTPAPLLPLALDQILGNRYVLVSLFSLALATDLRPQGSRLTRTQARGV